MKTFQSDTRKFNVLLSLGLLLIGLTYFSIKSPNEETRIVWSIFLFVFGFLLVGIALVNRHIVSIENDRLIIKNRLNILNKVIHLNDIKRIKVIDKEYPVSLHSNTILNLFLWDKKFNRFKQIELFDLFNNKLFTIDGQAIDNPDFVKLIKCLKH